MSSQQERFGEWARRVGGTGSGSGVDPGGGPGRGPAEPAVPDAVPAATVILLRDTPSGVETLMLRRDSRLAFAGGAWVFPGGRIDPADYEPSHPDDVYRAARRAAVREAAEESGLEVDLAGLVWLSHWMPPPQTPRRFSTWFFVAPAPGGEVRVDGGEIREHMWVRPAEALERRDAHEVELTPPTWVTLHELRASSDVASALAATRAGRPEHFTTKACIDGTEVIALWHGDAGYESGDPSVPGPRHRLRMIDHGWRYERTAPRPGPPE